MFLDPAHPCTNDAAMKSAYPPYPVEVTERGGALFDGSHPLLCGGKFKTTGKLNGECYRISQDNSGQFVWSKMPHLQYDRYGFSMTALPDWKQDIKAVWATGMHVHKKFPIKNRPIYVLLKRTQFWIFLAMKIIFVCMHSNDFSNERWPRYESLLEADPISGYHRTFAKGLQKSKLS